ncbi:MAG: MFS transporter permease [Desulfosporosinus sp. BRH_c37]|nr:MAG: MFS transporter permease [Desulfosporosinus sp. BRH_c37]
MSTKVKWSAYEIKAVALLAITFGVLSLDRWLIAPLFPLIMKDLHLNYQDIGNLAGVLSVSWGIFSAVLGGLSDKVGRRKVLIPAVIGFSIFSACAGLAAGFMSLLMMRALMGVVEGGFTPTSIATTHEASHESRTGLNIGIQQSTFALIGLGFGPIIATQMLKVVSWHWVFVISAIPGLICAAFLYKVIREPEYIQKPTAANADRPAWNEVFKYRNVILNMVSLLGIMTCFFVISAMTPTYLTDYLHLSVESMGFVTSAIGFGGFVGALGLPAISDKIGRKMALWICFILGFIALVIYMNTGNNPSALFVLLFIISACGFGNLIMNTAVIPAESVPVALRGAASGLPIAVGEIFGGGVAPSLAGYVAQNYGLYYILYIAVAGWVFGAIISLFLKETAPIKVVKKIDKNENGVLNA